MDLDWSDEQQMLAEYDIGWFEEALPPDDLEGFVRLRNASPVPIAGCEVFTRRQSFLPWLERRAIDYVQPDVTKVGGISEEHRIAQYADDGSLLSFYAHGLGLEAQNHQPDQDLLRLRPKS